MSSIKPSTPALPARPKPNRTRAYVFAWALCPARRRWLQEEADRYTNGNRSALLDIRVFGLRNPKAQSRPSPADDSLALFNRAIRMMAKLHLRLTALEHKGTVSAADLLAIRLDLARAIPVYLPSGCWLSHPGRSDIGEPTENDT